MKFAEVRRYAMGLGAVTKEPHHHFSSFRVRGRIFVTVPPQQEHIHLFPGESAREQALAMYPEIAQKLLWGGKVVGLRVTLAAATPAVVKSMVLAAWQHKAGARTGAAAKRRPAAAATKPR